MPSDRTGETIASRNPGNLSTRFLAGRFPAIYPARPSCGNFV